MEGHFAFQSLKQFKPKNIFDMSLVTAAIRPSGVSYRDDLFNKEFHKNPSELIDEILKDNYGYLVYQEDIIRFLQEVCGLSGSEADNIRRAIGRKQHDRLEEAMPRILEGYCEMSDKPREIAEKEAKIFLNIIEEASSYAFGKNHSVAYCMIGYLCAYYRYYYTPYFITAFLNNSANEDDIRHGFELARVYSYSVEPPKFRYAKPIYSYDGETTIYKGLASVKWLNNIATEYLYTLKDKQFESFIDLLAYIREDGKGKVDSRQLEILIKINFFEEFGGNKKLMSVYNMFNQLCGSKQLSRGRDLPISEDILLKYATKVTEKTIFMETGSKVTVDIKERPSKFEKGQKQKWEKENTMEVTYYNVDMTDTKEPTEPRIITLLRDYELNQPNEFYDVKEQIEYDKEYYGYVNMKYNVHANYCYVQDVDLTYSPKITLYSLGSGKTVVYKISKSLFRDNPIKSGQAIIIFDYEEKPRWTRTLDGKFVPREDGSKENWLTGYSTLTDDEWKKASGGSLSLGAEKEYKRYLIYDLETGGFNPETSDVLEVGYIICEKSDKGFKEIKREQFLVKTDKEIKNSNIHGITNEMCEKDGITQEECLNKMLEFFSDEDTLLIGYNILGFDNSYFTNYAHKFSKDYTIINDSLDIQPVMKDRLNVKKGFKLEDAVKFYSIEGREQAHRAISDCVDCLNILNAYVKEGKDIDKWIKRRK